eukprot:scaffold2325_cov257-Pinguiococcus_pyrenoidosus.AAC.12
MRRAIHGCPDFQAAEQQPLCPFRLGHHQLQVSEVGIQLRCLSANRTVRLLQRDEGLPEERVGLSVVPQLRAHATDVLQPNVEIATALLSVLQDLLQFDQHHLVTRLRSSFLRASRRTPGSEAGHEGRQCGPYAELFRPRLAQRRAPDLELDELVFMEPERKKRALASHLRPLVLDEHQHSERKARLVAVPLGHGQGLGSVLPLLVEAAHPRRAPPPARESLFRRRRGEAPSQTALVRRVWQA